MRADKPDAVTAAIVAELRQRGYHVEYAKGMPFDLLVIGHSHATNMTAVLIVEVKDPGKPMRFTKSERALQSQLFEKDFHGIYCVAQNTETILKWYGAL